MDGEDKDRPPKRRKVDERPLSSRELAPRPPNVDINQSTPTLPPPKTTTSSGLRRSTSLNLKNYPSNHHPVGVAIWILQKVEQARRELDAQQPSHSSTHASTAPVQHSAINPVFEPARSNQWPGSSIPSYVNVPPAQEAEAERLQAQRNRKTKQRQENWAKNKETDVVARAKIEAKKHFEVLPNASDADQQVWIEEKVRLDFGRLLDRLAAQLNSEIVGIPPYQIGYADYYFNSASNPQLSQYDDETITAARLICYVLPALTESVVSARHQYDADALVNALVQNTPQQDAFSAAIYMLAQDHQLLAGLDKLMGNLFLPKTGPQLARKRAGNASDLSGSSFGASSYSSTPHGAPIWHWKEPATIANSGRYISPSAKALASNGEAPKTVVQPYHQDTLPPPVRVQAAVFRPPPLPPPPEYYPYPYMQSLRQNYPQKHYPESFVAPALFGNGLNHVNYETRDPMSHQPLVQPRPQTRSCLVQDSSLASPALSQPKGDSPSGNIDPDTRALLSGSPGIDPSAFDDQVEITRMIMSPPKLTSISQTSSRASEERSDPSTSPEVILTSPEAALDANSRRRSSRGTILTSKAKAAGIMLGTQMDSPDQVSVSKVSRASRARKLSTPTQLGEAQPRETSSDVSKSTHANGIEPTKLKSMENSGNTSKDPSDISPHIEGFVPRSSGRERKPTAKILASSAVRSGLKQSDFFTSVPRVSSKLRLSLSSRSSDSSEGSITQVGGTDSLSPLGKTCSPQSGTQALTKTIQDSKPSGSQPVDLRGINPKEVVSPDLQAPRHAATPKPKKNAKFLTNDNGQSMSQALLMVAHIAADWSDSEDSEDGDETEEHLFQSKLQQAIDKQLQQSQLLKKTQTVIGASLPSSPVVLQPTTTDSNVPAASRHNDTHLAQTQVVRETRYRPTTDSSSNHSNPALVPRNLASNYHQPVVLPTLPSSCNSIVSQQNNGLPPHVSDGLNYPGTDTRTISQITDDWLSIVRLKDEARSRGLPISDSVGLDQLVNLLRAHDTGKLNVSRKPSFKTLAPSPACPAATSNDLPNQGGTVNGNANGNHYAQSPGISPSQFYSSNSQSESRHPTTPSAPLSSNVAPSSFPRHVQYIAPNVRNGEQDPSASTLNPERPGSAEPMNSNSMGRSHFHKATEQNSSRYEYNPQGLNGGPPGGGTIINGPETRGVQAKQRQSSKGPNGAGANGTMDERRNSTLSTRESDSATPQPQIPNFKKGGILVSFGKKAPRAAAV